MGLFNQISHRVKAIRRAGESLIAERLNGEALSLSAEIPGSKGPLWQMQLEMKSEPEAGGERLRLRAHFKLSLRRSSVTPDASRPSTSSGQALTPHALPEKVGHWIERRMQSRLMQTLAAPLLDRDLNTWIEVQTSSAALDAGARALLPAQLAQLGIEPKSDQPVQAWAGELRGARPGFAQMTLLQLDQRHLPPQFKNAFGGKPFQLTAAVVNVIEEAH